MATSLPFTWFAAPAPVVGEVNVRPAEAQFDSLFAAGPSPWPTLAGQPSVVSVTITFVQQASTAELQQIFSYVRQNGLKLALTTGVVPIVNGVGSATEGYVNPAELQGALQRIQTLGGTVDILSMDSPLHAGHEETGNTAQLSIPALAQAVAGTVAMVKSFFPNAQVSESEPLVSTGDITQWVTALNHAMGTPLASLQADAYAGDANIQTELEQFASAVRAGGTAFGLIVDDLPGTSNASWTTGALKMFAMAAADPLIAPSQFVTSTWNAYPTQLLPAGLSGTLAHVAVEVGAVAPLYQSGLLSGTSGTAALVAPSSGLLPGGLDAVVGGSVAVPGITLGGAAPAGAEFAVVVTDVSGTLTAQAATAGTVSQAGTSAMLLTGTLAAIDAELATLRYTAGAPGADAIDVTAFGGNGLIGEVQLAVAAAAPVGGAASGGVDAQAQAQSDVTTLLQQMGTASPTTAAVADLTGQLLAGASLASLRASLVASPGVVATLNQIARASTGAAPGAATLSAMQALLLGGQSVAQVAASLLPNSAAQQQVQALYQQELGTAPDAATLAQLTLASVTGTSTAALRATIAALPGPSDALSTMYLYVEGAAPTAAQLGAMQAQMAAGASLQQVEAQLDAVARSEVTTIYAQTLDRAPRADEMTVSVLRLEVGDTQAFVQQIAVLSTEEQANITAAVRASLGAAPTRSELSFMQSMLEQEPLDAFRAQVAGIANAYQQVTGTPIDQASFDAYLGQAANGQTLAAIRNMMTGGNNVRQTVANAYVKDFGHGLSPDLLLSLQHQLNTESMPALLANLAAQARADLPTLGGVVSVETLQQGQWLMPLRGLQVGDTSSTQWVTATVKLSSPAAKIISNWGGTTSGDGSSFTTVTAMPATIQQFLDALAITPSQVTAATPERLTVTLTNNAGNSVTATETITVQPSRAASFMEVSYGTAGNDTLAGTSNPDLFVMSSPHFGQDVLTGFDVAHDIVQLPAAAFANFAAVQHAMIDTAAGAVVRLDAQDSITFAGIAANSLTARDFSFA